MDHDAYYEHIDKDEGIVFWRRTRRAQKSLHSFRKWYYMPHNNSGNVCNLAKLYYPSLCSGVTVRLKQI